MLFKNRLLIRMVKLNKLKKKFILIKMEMQLPKKL